MKDSVLNYSLEEWVDKFGEMGEKKFRAKQLMQAAVRGEELSNTMVLSKELREKLSENYENNTVKIYKKLVSNKDGTIKYLFDLSDGNIVEGVLMKYKYGNTICISTQVGCRMNCAFCASGVDGLARNLAAGEILGQVIVANKDISPSGERAITNIVLMGSGEPLDNYDNVVKFLRLVSSPDGMGVSPRNISLSTSGIVDKIYQLADEGLSVTLTISLHAPTDEAREILMPINKKYPLKELIKAAKHYFETTGRRLIFEYAMIDGVNDSLRSCEELSKLLKGLPCHVNLIRLNHVDEKRLRPSRMENIQMFMDRLDINKISHTLRRTMGSDIEGACGQLRRKVLSEDSIEE